MANIPEDGAVLAEDSALADESDPDKRVTQQLWDKMVAPENEFEEGKSGNRNESVAKKESADSGKSDEAMEVDGAASGDAKTEAANF
jgi:hypothetical protein